MNAKTQYRPRSETGGSGPLFDTMVAASLWVIMQREQGEWRVELVRAGDDLDDARDYWQPPFHADPGDLSGCGETADERNA